MEFWKILVFFYALGCAFAAISVRTIINDVISYFEEKEHKTFDDFEIDDIPRSTGLAGLVFLIFIPLFNFIVALTIAANKQALEEALIERMNERRK